MGDQNKRNIPVGEFIQANTIYDFMGKPWSPFQVANLLRGMIREGGDLSGMREMCIAESGLNQQQVDAILGTLESEWTDKGDIDTATKIANLIPELTTT
jgi:hypothetical protein